jgi:ketosteroid isomerase-like protein
VSREDAEVVRRAYEAYARGDMATAGSAYSEDTAWDLSRFRPDMTGYEGTEALGEAIRTWREAWTDHFFSLERLVDAGDRLVAVIHEGGKGRESGVEVAMHYGQVIKVPDGKIVETIVYRDPDEAFRAAGLSSL